MEKNPNNNIQSIDWEYTDDKLEMTAESGTEQKESKNSFGKNALRTFGAIALTATLALGMAGCGNKEVESVDTPSDTVVTEEAPVVEGDDEVIGGMEEEIDGPEVVGEDSTDTLTIDEILEEVGNSDIVEALNGNNQEVLNSIKNWMEQNGYYDIDAELHDEYTPVCRASATLQSDGSTLGIIVELNPGSGGVYNIIVDDEDGKRVDAFQGPELPSSLQLNELIENN